MRPTPAPGPRAVRRHAVRGAIVALVALVAVTVTGCGDDSGQPATEERDENRRTPALTAEQVDQALLQPENLGDGWTAEPSTEDEDEAPGCLADVETLTEGLAEREKAGTDFSYGETLDVESTVSVYPNEAAITAVFDQVQVAVAACTSVTGADGDGNTWDLTLTASDEATYDGVDDQYSLSGSGTITTPDGASFDVHVEQTAVRLGPNVASVSTADFQTRTSEHPTWTGIAVQRLVAVAAGEDPESTTAPPPA